jgi:mRNA interferase MazF
MNQRDIFLANLGPVTGQEQDGTRPVVIISGNALNENTDICIICPITSHIKNFPGSMVLKKNEQNGLHADTEVITFQVRVLSQKRLIRQIGTVSEDELAKIREGLVEVLTY